MGEIKNQVRKYFIMGSQNCTRDPLLILEEAIRGGITAFQFREKGPGSLTGNEKVSLGIKLREICREHNILFLINDDVELIEPLNADGIHVGQEDVSVERIRETYPDILIGLSVSSMEEVKRSPLHLVDYVGAGPVFSTTTKEDAKVPVGLGWIRTLRSTFPELPIVGIGGINPDNAQSVIEAGADGVSLISAITEAENIIDTVQRI